MRETWKPKYVGQPYWETAPMRRNGSRHRDRLVKWNPGCLRACRTWSSGDHDPSWPIWSGMKVSKAGRMTWYDDDPYGRYMKPQLRASLVLARKR